MDLSELIKETTVYFDQQKEFYGDELYGLSRSVLSSAASRQVSGDSADDSFDLTLCGACTLTAYRLNRVVGQGPSKAKVMVIGGVPGEEDISTHTAFSGEVGALTEKILTAIGFKRSDVFFTNILKCRTPGGRMPESSEINTCIQHLDKQIEQVKPVVILAFGVVAGSALSSVSGPFEKIRGKVYTYRGVPLMATYHPGNLFVKPDLKRTVWEDVKKLRSLFAQTEVKGS